MEKIQLVQFPKCYVTAPGVAIGRLTSRPSLKSGIPCFIVLPDNSTVMRKGNEISLLEHQIPTKPWQNSVQDNRGQTVTVGNRIRAVRGKYGKTSGIVCGLTPYFAFVQKEASTEQDGEVVPMRVTDIYRCKDNRVPALTFRDIHIRRKFPATIDRNRYIDRKSSDAFRMGPVAEEEEENEPAGVKKDAVGDYNVQEEDAADDYDDKKDDAAANNGGTIAAIANIILFIFLVYCFYVAYVKID